MNTARIVVLAIALGAGGIVACAADERGFTLAFAIAAPRPEQDKALARSRQSFTLPLAQRGTSDVNLVESNADGTAVSRGVTAETIGCGHSESDRDADVTKGT
jgi:hypothetical protein